MKLKKCYVFSFGKLQNITFDLQDGLNTFKQDNGWGKSTLATFVKAIFYGLTDSKKNVAENERLKYKTWNSMQKFGGYIEFEWGGKEFKLERYFGNKQSEDTVSLVDLATGRSYSDTDNLGARIFQIDEEGFLSTTYFSQKDFQAKSNTSITAKFNATCEIQDSEAFDNAVKKLEEKAKIYKKAGDKGLIADTKRQIFEIGDEIKKVDLAVKTCDSLKQGVVELETQVKNLKEKTNILTQRVSEAGKAEANAIKKSQYDSYIAKKEQYLKQKAQYEKVLNGERPTEHELSVYFDCCNELSRASEREKILADDIQKLQNQPVKKVEAKKTISTPTLICLIFSILFACAGVGVVFAEIIWLSITFFVLSVVGIVLAIVFRNYNSAKNVVQEDSNQSFIGQKIIDYNEYKNIRQNYQQKIGLFLQKFNTLNSDYFTALTEIVSACKNVSLIDKEIDDLNASISAIEGQIVKFENDLNSENLASLKNQLESVQDEYAKKANELARKTADIKYYQDKADKLSELEEIKEELQLKLEQYKEEHQVILRTLEFLDKADENLKVKYRAPLENSLNKYLSLITGSSKTALIDIDLNVTIEENGGAKQIEYYSKGEQNLFEICKRFALTDVLFTGEKPFIILDDPFYNLDDYKLKQALELIKKLSNEYQILYFVCHESRRA